MNPGPDPFDAAIGNPPYQKSHNIGKPIWQDFVLRNLELLGEGGTLAMIHPPRWRGPGKVSTRSMDAARAALRDLDFEWISMTSKRDCAKTFPGILIPFDAYVARKSRSPGFMTDVEGTDGSSERVGFGGMEFIPNFGFGEVMDLVAREGGERVDCIHESAPFYSAHEWMSPERTDEFRHPCVHTVSADRSLRTPEGGKPRIIWSSALEPPVRRDWRPMFGTPKVIFGVWHESGIPLVDAEGKYGLTEKAAAIADDPGALPLIAKAMDSDRFRRLMAAARFTTHDWNLEFIRLLRKDFWKAFIDGEGG